MHLPIRFYSLCIECNPRRGIPDPIHRTRDLPRIQEALRLATQDALRLHKRMGYPIAVWRDGQVVWIPPEEIRVDVDSES